MDHFPEINSDLGEYYAMLRNYIHSFFPVEDEHWNKFSPCLELKNYKKGETLIDIGQVENNMYFLLKGAVMQMYHRKDQYHVTRFIFPCTFFNSFQSFMKNEPSIYRIEVLSDVSVFRIKRTDLDNIFQQFEGAVLIRQKLTESILYLKEQREISFQSKSTEENYQDLINTDPNINTYVPQKYIASYLGVAPESLSRIRQKKSDK